MDLIDIFTKRYRNKRINRIKLLKNVLTHLTLAGGAFGVIMFFPGVVLASRRPNYLLRLDNVGFIVPPDSSRALVGRPHWHATLAINRKNEATCIATRKPSLKSHRRPVNLSMSDDLYAYGSGEYAFFAQNLVSVESHLIRWLDTMKASQNIVLGRYNLDLPNSSTQLRLLATSEWKQQTIICTLHAWTRLGRPHFVLSLGEVNLFFEKLAVLAAQNKWRMEESLVSFHCGNEEYCLPAQEVYRIENTAMHARRVADETFGRLIWTHFNFFPEELN